jgi:hypothetical protein
VVCCDRWGVACRARRPENGTWAEPLLPFNELNREEPSRYTPIGECTFLVEFFPDGVNEVGGWGPTRFLRILG